MVGIVHNKYAEALYKLALEKEKLDLIAEEAKAVKSIVEDEEDFMKVLCHPQIVEDCKIEIVKNSFQNKISEELMGMILLTIRKNRQNILIDILEGFIGLVKGHNNISSAVVTSAIDLSDEYIKRIQDELQAKLNGEVEIKTQVDKSVIGGLKININNKVFDRTIATRLNAMRQAL